jgi:hypothetical protein
VLAAGIAPHATVMFEGTDIVGKADGFTVIVLETGARTLPQASFAVQVSVIVPPHAPDGDCTEKVDVFEIPLIRHPFDNPLV